MTFFSQKPSYQQPLGSFGPLEEFESMMGLTRLRPTPEQKLEAGQKSSIAFSNSNAEMIARALGYEVEDGAHEFDAEELRSRVVLAQAVSPVNDEGMASIQNSNMVSCGIRPGYFADAYVAIADVCDFAIAWQVPVFLS